MVPEKPKAVVLSSSAPVVNRRMPPQRPGAFSAMLAPPAPAMRRQPGVNSSSNLLRGVERLQNPRAPHEAPEPRTPSYATPSYMKTTTAASKKFRGPQGTPRQSPGGSNENMSGIRSTEFAMRHQQRGRTPEGSNENIPGHRSTGAVMKHQQRMMRKDPSTSTLKQINK